MVYVCSGVWHLTTVQALVKLIVSCLTFSFSAHPYIFFNWDGASITFVGFNVSPDGTVLDPDGEIIEIARMSPQLLAGLKHNNVDFAEDYRQWSKPKMIKKIGTVLGLDFVYDPDPTYVLTADNLVKILAIHMRFR